MEGKASVMAVSTIMQKMPPKNERIVCVCACACVCMCACVCCIVHACQWVELRHTSTLCTWVWASLPDGPGRVRGMLRRSSGSCGPPSAHSAVRLLTTSLYLRRSTVSSTRSLCSTTQYSMVTVWNS